MKKNDMRCGMRAALTGICIGILAGCVLLGGCKEKTLTEETKYDSLQGKRITFLTSQSKYFEEYQKMADMIYEKYGCDVVFQIVPDNEYASFVKLKLTTGQVPDVFEYNCPMQNKEIEVAHYCEDLSEEDWVGRLIDPDLIKDHTDGKIYALPKESASGFQAVYYNRQVLAECGIVNPHPGTWQEFLEILDQVKRKGKGTIPFYETNADAWTTQIFMTGGFPVALGEQTEETFQQLADGELKWTEVSEFREIMTLYTDLIRYGYVNGNHLSAGYKTAVKMLGTGQAAMYLTTEQCAADIVANYPACEVGAFVLPFKDRDVLPISQAVQGLFVPKDGEQVEVVKLFLQAWSAPEIQNIYLETQKINTAFTDADQVEQLECIQYLTANYLETGKYVYQMNDQISDYTAVFEELWTGYTQMVSWRKTPDEVLRDFQLVFEEYRKKNKIQEGGREDD